MHTHPVHPPGYGPVTETLLSQSLVKHWAIREKVVAFDNDCSCPSLEFPFSPPRSPRGPFLERPKANFKVKLVE